MSRSAFDGRSMGGELLRWLVAGVFIYAGMAKLADTAGLASSIARFQIAPLFLVNPAALGLPPLEIFCGLALLAGPWKRQASFALVLLSVIFLGALVSVAARGLTVECHCFGSAGGEPLWQSIVRDWLLLGAALVVHLRLRRTECSRRRMLQTSQPAAFFLSFS